MCIRVDIVAVLFDFDHRSEREKFVSDTDVELYMFQTYCKHSIYFNHMKDVMRKKPALKKDGGQSMELVH